MGGGLKWVGCILLPLFQLYLAPLIGISLSLIGISLSLRQP